MKRPDDNLSRDLFGGDPPPEISPPYQRGSWTSQQAADAIRPSAATLRGKVLAYIEQCGARGATDHEIQAALEMNPSTQRPRRIELVSGGFIVESDATRPTPSGRRAAVWIRK